MTTATDRRLQTTSLGLPWMSAAAPASSVLAARVWQLGGYYVAASAGSAGFPVFAVDYSSTQWASHPYTWTNIPASKIRSLSINRGRSDELSTMNAGTMTAVLDSIDRGFDPDHASLSTGSPVRVTATIGSTVYTVFSGYVDAWDPDEDVSDNDGTVTLTATDAFKMLARTELRGYQATVLRDAPVAYYRMGDGGSTMFDSSGHDRDGTYFGGHSVASTLVAGGDSARFFDGVDAYAQANISGIPFQTIDAQPVTLECWVNIPSGFDSGYIAHLAGGDVTTTAGSYIQIFGNGSLITVTANTASVNSVIATPGNAVDTDHHIVAVWSGSALTVWIDGVSYTAAVTGAGSGGKPEANSLHVGGLVATPVGVLVGIEATIDEVAVYDYALTAAQVARHYLSGTYFTAELSSDRVDRVLDMVGWPATARAVDVGQMTVGVQDSETDALTALRAAERAEDGTLFVSSAGEIGFHARDHSGSVASSATISDDSTAVSPMKVPRRFNESFLVNEVAVTWNADAAPVIVRDEASISQYGLVSKSVDAPLSTRAQAADIAGRILARYAEPATRIDECEVLVASLSTVPVESVIGLELGDVVTVVRTPLNTGSTLTVVERVEGISHTVRPDSWLVSLKLSPAQTVPWWRVGDSGDAGNVGTFRIN